MRCPLAQAAARLHDFFREHGNPEGDLAKLTLRLNANIAGFSLPPIERTVIASIQPHHLPADTTPRYRVQWAAEHSGPFPLFAGELVVESGDDYDTFTLFLRGDYTPPLGLVGKGFDAALGNRIARATANDLLHHVKELVEREFQSNEARKDRSVPGPD